MNKILFLGMVLIALVSCNDDKCTCSGEIYGKWEASGFMSLESQGYPKDDNYNPIIEFKSDGSISIQLDANACFGDFEIDGESNINISDAGCTEICCDSDFSNKFVQMLSQVGSFEIEGDEMKLNISGWGWIALNYVSD